MHANLVPGWIIDSVVAESTHAVVVSARGAEPVSPPQQPRFASIVIARVGHEQEAQCELDALVASNTVSLGDIIESKLVMWGGHGVAAHVLRAGVVYASEPPATGALVEPLTVEEPATESAVARPTLEERVEQPNAKLAVRRVGLAFGVFGALMAVVGTWIALTNGPMHGDATSRAADRVRVLTWDPVAATMSVEQGGRVLTFTMGEPGDEVLLGDWEGRGQRTPALYRPSTGDVWIFTEWATAGAPAEPKVTARTLAHGEAVVETKNGREIVTVYPTEESPSS